MVGSGARARRGGGARGARSRSAAACSVGERVRRAVYGDRMRTAATIYDIIIQVTPQLQSRRVIFFTLFAVFLWNSKYDFFRINLINSEYLKQCF